MTALAILWLSIVVTYWLMKIVIELQEIRHKL